MPSLYLLPTPRSQQPSGGALWDSTAAVDVDGEMRLAAPATVQHKSAAAGASL